MFKFKRKWPLVELIRVNGQDLSTGMVGSYCLRLRDMEDFKLGFFSEKDEGGILDFVIFGYKDQPKAIRYFKDRCPYIVEVEIRNTVAREFKTRKTGYGDLTEVIPVTWR